MIAGSNAPRLLGVVLVAGVLAGAVPAVPAEAQSPPPAVTCAKRGDKFLPIRTDGTPLGDPVAFTACRDAVKASREGVVCTFTKGKNFYLTRRIADITPLGARQTFDECVVATGAAKNGTVCAKIDERKNLFAPLQIATIRWLGSGMTLEECTAF